MSSDTHMGVAWDGPHMLCVPTHIIVSRVLYVYGCVCVCVCVCVRVCAFICLYMGVCMYMHTYVCVQAGGLVDVLYILVCGPSTGGSKEEAC